MNVPLVLAANLALELSRAFLWKAKGEFEIRELSEYWRKELECSAEAEKALV